MTTRMLIDARHREETRVAVVQGNRIEEFDFESAERKQLKGNIYLAKVTRVEPSLQAAFIDYGGNRHGFLAFSEIHPDYYQIPKEDRDALLREEAEHAAEEAALRAEQEGDEDDADESEEDDERFADDGGRDDDGTDEDIAGEQDGEAAAEGTSKKPRNGQDDQVEALRQRRTNLRHRYKIQDVIHRRQVLLVQVVKEERGNKGAALTTYLSLAGRYCVLMPNTSHGGGISRKISNAGDRKRLKSIMADLSLPASMGCIVRTAGLQRTRVEIKRDFDYLARLWDGIREETLKSAAPALVYGDSDLIKRAIRDIYNAGVDEVIVEGEGGYRQARDFMKLLSPSHARKVKQYADAVPLYQRAGVEDQLAAMYNPVVQLKSGGYLVINPTEALVSIDINSGRSTREHNIEQTATATNLEAAHEIARQLRLRDMAGLVVIDFIDMDNGSNVRKVEKAVKEALKNDRARIQVGRISQFGLMEMSRQRLRTGVLEASTRMCPHCEGTGLVRTAASSGLSALRLIEDEAARGRGSLLTLRASQEAAIYVLNRKRADIAEIEDRYGVQVEVLPDREQEGARMSVEAAGPPPAYAPRIEPLLIQEDEEEIVDEVEIDEEEIGEDLADDDGDEAIASEPRERGAREDDAGRKRRRRRRGRGRRGQPEGDETRTAEEPLAGDATGEGAEDDDDEAAGEIDAAPTEGDADQQEGGEGRRRRGRRGRRGGRRGAGEGIDEAAVMPAPEGDRPEPATGELAVEAADAGDAGPVTDALALADETATPAIEAPRARRRPRARPATSQPTAPEPAAPEPTAAEPTTAEPAAAEPTEAAVAEPPVEEVAPKPRRSRRKAPAMETSDTADAPAAPEPVAEPAPIEDIVEAAPKPRRSRAKAVASEAAPAQVVEAPAPAMPEPELALEQTPPVDGDQGAANDAVPAEGDEDGGAPRRGWWQRTFGA